MSYRHKDVVGFEKYYYLDPINKEVISKRTGKAIKLRRGRGGYPEVHLSVDGIDVYKRVHRLFAEAYIPNPDNLPCVNHKDEDRSNFHPDNLEWCDYKYNSNYGHARDRISDSLKGKKHPWVGASLGKNVVAVYTDGTETQYPSAREAARQLNISASKVLDILCGLRKSTHGYTFYYSE